MTLLFAWQASVNSQPLHTSVHSSPWMLIPIGQGRIFSVWISVFVSCIVCATLFVLTTRLVVLAHTLMLAHRTTTKDLSNLTLRDIPEFHGLWPAGLGEQQELWPPLLKSPWMVEVRDADREFIRNGGNEYNEGQGQIKNLLWVSTHELPADPSSSDGRRGDFLKSRIRALTPELDRSALHDEYFSETFALSGDSQQRPRGPARLQASVLAASSVAATAAATAAAAAASTPRRSIIPELNIRRPQRSPSPIIWSNPLPSLRRFVGTPHSSPSTSILQQLQHAPLLSPTDSQSLFNDPHSPISETSLFLPGHSTVYEMSSDNGTAYEISSTWVLGNVPLQEGGSGSSGRGPQQRAPLLQRSRVGAGVFPADHERAEQDTGIMQMDTSFLRTICNLCTCKLTDLENT